MIHATVRIALLAAALAGALHAAPAAAQASDPVGPVAPAAAVAQLVIPPSGEPGVTSPRGAFVRALVLPGWGHASIGAHTRGAFYFAAETTTGFLLVRTLRRLATAKNALRMEEDRLTEALMARGTPQDSVPGLLDADPSVEDARGLVESRQQQVEDWAALGGFLVFLSAADAFVSAHLRDFPAPLATDVDVVPGPAGNVARIGFRLSVGPGGR